MSSLKKYMWLTSFHLLGKITIVIDLGDSKDRLYLDFSNPSDSSS